MKKVMSCHKLEKPTQKLIYYWCKRVNWDRVRFWLCCVSLLIWKKIFFPFHQAPLFAYGLQVGATVLFKFQFLITQNSHASIVSGRFKFLHPTLPLAVRYCWLGVEFPALRWNCSNCVVIKWRIKLLPSRCVPSISSGF